MMETLDLIGKGLCIFLAAMLILFTGVAVAYLILNLGNKADAVPVVRCKDCKNWDTTWQNDWAKNYHYCPLIDGTRNGDWYCADGERKEE